MYVTFTLFFKLSFFLKFWRILRSDRIDDEEYASKSVKLQKANKFTEDKLENLNYLPLEIVNCKLLFKTRKKVTLIDKDYRLIFKLYKN